MLAACRAWTIARVQAEPAAQRTPEQAAKLKTIATVLKIPETSVPGHINYSTFTFRDITQKNGGVSPFGNERVRYVGSSDDAALNAGVPRFKADPAAVARFAADTDHRGRFAVPVLTAHGIGDATVFVEGSDTLRQRMVGAGNGDRLAQPADCRFLPDYAAKPISSRVLPR